MHNASEILHYKNDFYICVKKYFEITSLDESDESESLLSFAFFGFLSTTSAVTTTGFLLYT